MQTDTSLLLDDSQSFPISSDRNVISATSQMKPDSGKSKSQGLKWQCPSKWKLFLLLLISYDDTNVERKWRHYNFIISSYFCVFIFWQSEMKTLFCTSWLKYHYSILITRHKSCFPHVNVFYAIIEDNFKQRQKEKLEIRTWKYGGFGSI